MISVPRTLRVVRHASVAFATAKDWASLLDRAALVAIEYLSTKRDALAAGWLAAARRIGYAWAKYQPKLVAEEAP
jgi:hypothetical protein